MIVMEKMMRIIIMIAMEEIDEEDNMIMDMMKTFTRIMIMTVSKIITIIIPSPSQENGQGREIGDRSEAAQNKIRDLRKQARW